MLRLGMGELIIILLIVLVLFGAKRLPEIGGALGKALKEFKKAGKDLQDDVKNIADTEEREPKE